MENQKTTTSATSGFPSDEEVKVRMAAFRAKCASKPSRIIVPVCVFYAGDRINDNGQADQAGRQITGFGKSWWLRDGDSSARGTLPQYEGANVQYAYVK